MALVRSLPDYPDSTSAVALRPTGFSVKRDQLQADDCPKYLAKCLEYELKKRPIQREHVSETQPDEDKGLVEVFDKVRQWVTITSTSLLTNIGPEAPTFRSSHFQAVSAAM